MNFSEVWNVMKNGLSGLFPDIAFLIALSLEILVFVIKLIVWRKDSFLIRLAKLVIDEPLNLMGIVLGYIGALVAFGKCDDKSVFILFIALIIGLLIMSFFYETIVKLFGESRKLAIFIGAILVLTSYVLPFLELLIYAYLVGEKA